MLRYLKPIIERSDHMFDIKLLNLVMSNEFISVYHISNFQFRAICSQSRTPEYIVKRRKHDEMQNAEMKNLPFKGNKETI